MQDFICLRVWQKAHDLTRKIYQTTRKFPSEEKPGLISQIRKASFSIKSNVEEGCINNNDKEFARLISSAQGSVCEVQSKLILAKDLYYLPDNEFNVLEQKILEISIILSTLKQMLRSY